MEPNEQQAGDVQNPVYTDGAEDGDAPDQPEVDQEDSQEEAPDA